MDFSNFKRSTSCDMTFIKTFIFLFSEGVNFTRKLPLLEHIITQQCRINGALFSTDLPLQTIELNVA